MSCSNSAQVPSSRVYHVNPVTPSHKGTPPYPCNMVSPPMQSLKTLPASPTPSSYECLNGLRAPVLVVPFSHLATIGRSRNGSICHPSTKPPYTVTSHLIFFLLNIYLPWHRSPLFSFSLSERHHHSLGIFSCRGAVLLYRIGLAEGTPSPFFYTH